MTNYVPSIPDCERWKKYVSNIANNRSDSKLKSYVTSKSRLADIKVVSPIAGDLEIVKTRVRQYKKKIKENSTHTTKKGGTVKTSGKGKGKRKNTQKVKTSVKGKGQSKKAKQIIELTNSKKKKKNLTKKRKDE